MLTLEVALFCLGVARKGGLWLLVFQLVENLPVRDVADLEVLLDQLAVLVAHAALAVGHQSIAGTVGLADIAVDARPAFAALALSVASSWRPVLAICQRAAQRL